ncbi:hypothetical protein GA0115252_11086 [Streptomyces sp. DfronAA-171]|nr:hypothetical protein GA0115252_11086 [Streptomyces sp. DfronAA-171]
MTTTVSPCRTFALLSTAPAPVRTPQPSSAAGAKGISSGMTPSWFSWMSASCAKPLSPEKFQTGSPFQLSRGASPGARTVVSGRSQRYVRPARQLTHAPQYWMRLPTTWSPTRTWVTSGPVSVTTPATSWPRTAGNSPPRKVATLRSEWQSPEARTSTLTSCPVGSASVTSSTTKPCPRPLVTAAFMCRFLMSRARRRMPVAGRVEREAAQGGTGPARVAGRGRGQGPFDAVSGCSAAFLSVAP